MMSTYLKEINNVVILLRNNSKFSHKTNLIVKYCLVYGIGILLVERL